jgi:hypothetical protein
MFLNDFWKSLITWSSLVLLSLAVVLPLTFTKAVTLSNSCLIPGITYLGIACFSFIHRKGIFDIFEYQFTNWGNSFRKGSPKKYDTASDYHLAMDERRSEHMFPYLPFLAVGAVYVILSILFAYVSTGY